MLAFAEYSGLNVLKQSLEMNMTPYTIKHPNRNSNPPIPFGSNYRIRLYLCSNDSYDPILISRKTC